MITYGQAMDSEIDEALRLLNQYMIDGYDGSDIKNLLSKITSATELSLKRDMFPKDKWGQSKITCTNSNLI